jgi:hypothetical protein
MGAITKISIKMNPNNILQKEAIKRRQAVQASKFINRSNSTWNIQKPEEFMNIKCKKHNSGKEDRVLFIWQNHLLPKDLL